ncbi:putative membrane-associated kinase regulator 2 [Zea mays]|uniref:Putative membrane-associated kinase regulator 2 n=1 Tax=Zea mays TaxID=4577 RepID=A0A3L6FD41_MAIZE|nr:putative membrane-associated kinase regulator 2 [Zea mays]
MDSFSLLKYLRGGVAAGAQRAPAASTTIAASACENGDGDGDDDAASFFDLEFAVPGDESAASDAEEERVEFNFAVAPGAADTVAVAVDAPAAEAEAESEADAEAPPPAPLLRPATRFRVLLLKLRKPKASPADGAAQAPPRQPAVASRFLVKFRVEDAPLASLFTRDNSSRTSDAGADRRAPAVVAVEAQQQEEEEASASASVTAEERRFAKEVVLRYLSSKIKPLYVKVSRRYGERLRLGGAASEGEETDAEPDPSPAPASEGPLSSAPAPAPAPQPVVVACGVRAPRAGVPAGLRQVCKRLGKSRSASSAVAAAPSPAAAAAVTGPQAQRRDDSLLQVQDGIQSAIAHCKRSFNASKEPRSMTATTGGAGEGA